MVDVNALFILCGLVAVSLLQFDFWLKFHENVSLAHLEFTSTFLQIQVVMAGLWNKTLKNPIWPVVLWYFYTTVYSSSWLDLVPGTFPYFVFHCRKYPLIVGGIWADRHSAWNGHNKITLTESFNLQTNRGTSTFLYIVTPLYGAAIF